MSPGWMVLICILALLALALWFPVRIWLSYSEEGISCGIKLLFWTLRLFPGKEKKETPGQKARREKKERDKALKAAKRMERKSKPKRKRTVKEQKSKRSLTQWMELITLLAASAGRAARRFWKGFVIDRLTFHMAVAGADAADTAISYGKINAQAYTVYAFLMQFVTLRRTDIQIVPDFLSQESRLEISGELFFRVGTLLASGFAAGWHLLKGLLGDRLSLGEKESP